MTSRDSRRSKALAFLNYKWYNNRYDTRKNRKEPHTEHPFLKWVTGEGASGNEAELRMEVASRLVDKFDGLMGDESSYYGMLLRNPVDHKGYAVHKEDLSIHRYSSDVTTRYDVIARNAINPINSENAFSIVKGEDGTVIDTEQTGKYDRDGKRKQASSFDLELVEYDFFNDPDAFLHRFDTLTQAVAHNKDGRVRIVKRTLMRKLAERARHII